MSSARLAAPAWRDPWQDDDDDDGTEDEEDEDCARLIG